MKVLCLHGAYGSASNFEVQLNPFTGAVEKPGSVEFRWINGSHAATPPDGFDDYFGAKPLYRFIEFDGVGAFDDIMNNIRDIPTGSTPEETMRLLVGPLAQSNSTAVQTAIDRLLDIIDQDPEIEGILGYSEGATAAATLILEERRRFEEQGRPRRIKHAIFFAGWPPVRLGNDGGVECILADECDDIIDIPTCHVIGSKDPYIDGAIALYSVCDEEMAVLFDHGKGHTVPRDAATIQQLSSALEQTWKRQTGSLEGFAA